LKTADGDDAGTYESIRCDWQPGDELRASGNTRYRVTAVVPLELVEEFVEKPLYASLEVEPLAEAGFAARCGHSRLMYA
jgi:hypothetical protein